jgi:hypothetical protein
MIIMGMIFHYLSHFTEKENNHSCWAVVDDYGK